MKLNDRRILMMSMVCAVLLFPGASAILPASAQPKPPAQSKCPVIRVSCPAEVSPKDGLTMTVNVSGGDPNVTPTYNWSISAGTISSGQGTSTIQVDTSGVEGGSTVTATVELGGFSPECSIASSCTTSLMMIKKAEARKTDEYGKIKLKDEGARLDNFSIELMNDPTVQAHIISYNGIKSRPGDAQKTADRSKNYLVNKRRVDSSRVVAVVGGYREEPLVELWIVPTGAPAPTPTPTVNPSPAKSTPKTATTKAKKPLTKKPVTKKPAKPKA